MYNNNVICKCYIYQASDWPARSSRNNLKCAYVRKYKMATKIVTKICNEKNERMTAIN